MRELLGGLKNPPVPFLNSEEGDTRSMADGYPAWRYVCQLKELAYHPDLLRGFDNCYVDYLTDYKGDIVWIEVNSGDPSHSQLIRRRDDALCSSCCRCL